MWLSCENSLKKKKEIRMKGIHKFTKVLLRLQICKMHTFLQKIS
jgi:hypothetical protein